jgi:hypothetical protein
MAGRVTDPSEWPWNSYRFAIGAAGGPAFLSLEDVWRAFGTFDPKVGRKRLGQFVSAGLQEVFLNPLLHGSDRLSRFVAPLLKPHENTSEYVYPQRHAARPSVGAIFEGCRTQEELDVAAYRAFFEHAYTLREIGVVVSRDPSVVCRWIRRVERHAQQRLASPPEDNLARNKI